MTRRDQHRREIMQAMRELLTEMPFSDISVSMISDRAGIKRSALYFYFDSKNAILMRILAETMDELDGTLQQLLQVPRGESPANFVRWMLAGALGIWTENQRLLSACHAARNLDADIREASDLPLQLFIDRLASLVADEVEAGNAHPVSDDIPALVRSLVATTAFTLAGDSAFVGPSHDLPRAMGVLEDLWLRALWGPSDRTAAADAGRN
jgi:AcrR family transcriptional regulator